MTDFRASVILTTRNRATKLGRTLDAFECLQTSHEWQLVIVDNGSTDGTDSVLKAFQSRTNLAVTLAFEARPGIANAKNAGLQAASGTLIIHTDDDCYPAPDFIEAWVTVFDSTDLDFAAGRIELFTQDDAPVTIRTDLEPHRLPLKSMIPGGYLQGANAACRRHVSDTIGMFDPRFGSGGTYKGGNDAEYFQRASNHGFRGGYEPGPVVYHHHERKLRDIPALERKYDTSYGAFLVKTLIVNPRAAMVRFTGSDGAGPTPAKKFYWDARRSGIQLTLARRLTRWRRMLWGGAYFTINAARGRHSGYW